MKVPAEADAKCRGSGMYQIIFSEIGYRGVAPTDSFETLVDELARQTIDPPTESFITMGPEGMAALNASVS